MPSANLMPHLCNTSTSSSDVYLPLRMSHLNNSSLKMYRCAWNVVIIQFHLGQEHVYCTTEIYNYK